MKSRSKDYLPQSEAEWLATEKFTVETMVINRNRIRCALAQGSKGRRLITMVGGIPRDPARRRKLPLINKLYGHLAILMLDHRMNSLLYNQPATGGSSGEWESETFRTRSMTLAGIVRHFCEQTCCSDNVLIGTSAGAYIAVNAVDQIQNLGYSVSKLVLLSPAAYPKEIEDVPYGEEFTRIVRTPWDIAKSPVFQKLEKFVASGGSLLISFFEADDPPIPLYIQEYYRGLMRQFSKEGGDVSMITIPGVAHNFRRIGVPEGKNVVDNDSVRATATTLSTFLR